MSYASPTQTGRPSATFSLAAMLSALKEKYLLHRSYRQTVSALSQLSDTDLADLGMSHSAIHSMAHNAVYGGAHRR